MSELTKALNNVNWQKGKKIGIEIVLYTILVLVAVITIFPYIWMLFTTFKGELEAMNPTISLWPKDGFSFESYQELAEQNPSFFRAMLNTLIIEVTVVPIGTLVSALAAFSFSKMRLPCKTFFLLLLMSGMMVPYAAVMLPQYRYFSDIGWTGTLLPLIIPGLFGNVSMMFFFIQYMKSTPTSLIEAGRVDGASWLRIFWQIVLPTIVPALAAQVIFWFLGIWNDYFAPSIYLGGSEWLTVQALLALLNDNNARRPDLPLVMAGATVSSIPMIVLYICFQKYFVQSLALTGIKE